MIFKALKKYKKLLKGRFKGKKPRKKRFKRKKKQKIVQVYYGYYHLEKLFLIDQKAFKKATKFWFLQK